jgi:hypothetical protein
MTYYGVLAGLSLGHPRRPEREPYLPPRDEPKT